MDVLLLIFFALILVFGIAVFVIVVSRGRATSFLDVDKYRSSWLSIEQKLNKDEPATYVVCIMEADKLLDHALKERGFKGGTMGERMKSASSAWKDANAVWKAHKLRNQLAHEQEVKLRYPQVRGVLACFKQGLKDVGAI
jgi:hypothetical protein